MEELCRGTFRPMVEFALAVAASTAKLLSELHAQSSTTLSCVLEVSPLNTVLALVRAYSQLNLSFVKLSI
jgi:hypothetical protein